MATSIELENVGRERYMVKDVKAKIQVDQISKELKALEVDDKDFYVCVNRNVESKFIKDDESKKVELVSKELNHFGVIAGLFRQIGGHSSRFVLFCSFLKKNNQKCKSISLFFLKNNIFFLLHKIQTPGKNMQNGRQVI